MAELKPVLLGLVKKTFVPDGKLVTRIFYFEKPAYGCAGCIVEARGSFSGDASVTSVPSSYSGDY